MPPPQNINLSSVLQHGREEARRNKNQPCLVYLDENGQANGSLSYPQALASLQLHREWLQGTLEDLFGNTTKDHQRGGDIVVAFLSENSADFFLSVLASCSLPRRRVLPALFNTRWTAHEMAAALKSISPSDQTLIIYGPSFCNVAETVQQLILQQQQQQQPRAREQGTTPLCCCQPIPQLTQQRVQHSNNTSLERYVSVQKEFLGFRHFQSLSQAIQELSLLRQSCDNAQDDNNNNDALILFTSGTTSGAKGVRLSHLSLLIQAFAKLEDPCGLSSETKLVASTLPFFHVGGLTNLLAVWLAGGTLLLPRSSDMLQRGFDPRFLLSSLQGPDERGTSGRCNTLVVVPAMLHMLQKEMETVQRKLMFPHVKLILIGGQSASSATLEFLRERFPHARLVQTYACTEAASSLTFHDVSKRRRKVPALSSITGDCAGKPPRHVQLRLVSARDKTTVLREPFQVGLIATRGPHLMNGYWKRGEHVISTSTVPKSNWFVTSDLGTWDEKGNLYFCGRASDTIRTGGETVLALEVERLVQQHPQIDEVAVFSAPSERYGEMVACGIVLKQKDTSINVEELRAWCKQRGLAGFKCPRQVMVLDSLPCNSSGKVLKPKLQQLFIQKYVHSKL